MRVLFAVCVYTVALFSAYCAARDIVSTPIEFRTSCPKWDLINTTYSFTRTDGQHNIADGINMFKIRLFDLIYDSICHRRHIIAPGIRVDFDTYKTVEFSEIFSLNHFNAYLYRAHKLFVVPRRCMNRVGPLTEARYDAAKTCVSANDEHRFNNTIASNSYAKIANSIAIRKQLTLNLFPSLRLQKLGVAIRRQMLTEKYICLHARTEHDFKTYQQNKPPGYYTIPQIVEKLRLTMLHYPDLFSGLDDIYVTGNHNETALMITEFARLGKRIHTKNSLSNFVRSLSYTETAVIDQYVCEKAAVFIGNNHSAWSELVYQLRAFIAEQNNSTDVTNFQYNSKSPDEPVVAVMHPFCTITELEYHGRKCQYYRRL